MKFNQSVVVDACDLPQEVAEWCCDNDISTHYEESIVRVWKDDDTKDHMLLNWVIAQGVDMEQYSDDDVYYISVIGS